MTHHEMIIWVVLIAGLSVGVFQLCFDIYLLQRVRRCGPEDRPQQEGEPTERYYERFFQTPPPSEKLRALYVSEQTYHRYMGVARSLLGQKGVYHLTDAILRDHLKRYAKPIDACLRDISSEER